MVPGGCERLCRALCAHRQDGAGRSRDLPPKKIRFACNDCVEKGWDSLRENIPVLQLPALGLVLIIIPVATRSTLAHKASLSSFPSSEPVERLLSHGLDHRIPWISPNRSLGTSGLEVQPAHSYCCPGLMETNPDREVQITRSSIPVCLVNLGTEMPPALPLLLHGQGCIL